MSTKLHLMEQYDFQKITVPLLDAAHSTVNQEVYTGTNETPFTVEQGPSKGII